MAERIKKEVLATAIECGVTEASRRHCYAPSTIRRWAFQAGVEVRTFPKQYDEPPVWECWWPGTQAGVRAHQSHGTDLCAKCADVGLSQAPDILWAKSGFDPDAARARAADAIWLDSEHRSG